VRIVVLVRLAASPLLLPARGDMHFYDAWAQRILNGHFTNHLAFYGLPLYAYLLGLVYKLVGYGPFVPGLLQAALEAGTAVILYKLGARVFSGPLKTTELEGNGGLLRFVRRRRGQFIGAMAALGWAFFAPAQAYAAILMPTVCLVFTFWLLVWLLVRSDLAPTRLASFGYGLLVGFTAMGVATILFLVPLLLGAILLKPSRRPVGHELALKLIASLLLFSGIGIGTSPCWVHNYFIARDPVFLSAHSGVNLWIGNNPMATGYPRFPPGLHAGQEVMLKDSINGAEAAAGHPLKRSEISAYWSAKAKDYIRHHFNEWLELLCIKIKNFWNAFQYDDLSMITALREHGVIFPALRFGVVAALGIPGLLIAWCQSPRSRWIAVAILLQMFALLPVFITERYRLAAVPGLLLFAAFGLSIFWQACTTHQFRTAAVYFALLVGSTIFVAWPVRDPALWALDTYNSGWQALESNDLALAEQKLKLAYEYVPENAETNFALGNLRLEQGNKSEAKSYYLATLRLDPTHEGSYNNLGILALEEKRWNLAAVLFAKAIAQNPHDAKTHYLLARTFMLLHDRPQAICEIAKAIDLEPNRPAFLKLRDDLH
jgi:tetratricopeptide (TPR) repeat protein